MTKEELRNNIKCPYFREIWDKIFNKDWEKISREMNEALDGLDYWEVVQHDANDSDSYTKKYRTIRTQE
jgi:hypothetical protein